MTHHNTPLVHITGLSIVTATEKLTDLEKEKPNQLNLVSYLPNYYNLLLL